MKPIQSDSLENYVARHRTDFDAHEPRPELWAALESELHPVASGRAAPTLRVSAAEPATAPVAAALPDPRPRGGWWRYGIAAGLAALGLAAGAGEVWKARHPSVGATVAVGGERATAPTETTLYQTPETTLLAASNRADEGRLDTAVRGMERYYLRQLQRRRARLHQLAPEDTADCVLALQGLDSSYQHLKRALPRHPQPAVVLTAMNRNLQIRLDIIDQQLALRGAGQPAGNAVGEYVLAESQRGSGEVGARGGH